VTRKFLASPTLFGRDLRKQKAAAMAEFRYQAVPPNFDFCNVRNRFDWAKHGDFD
jgi:hypothetical protein